MCVYIYPAYYINRFLDLNKLKLSLDVVYQLLFCMLILGNIWASQFCNVIRLIDQVELTVRVQCIVYCAGLSYTNLFLSVQEVAQFLQAEKPALNPGSATYLSG